jgi:signal transduction histidine kinase
MYLTAREVLTGLAEHTAATREVVAVIAGDGRLSLRVTSDGRLADEAGSQMCLSVIIDRVEADGGEVSVRSVLKPIPELGGIWVEAWIPCG